MGPPQIRPETPSVMKRSCPPFAGVGAAHDCREQDDLCPPNVLLWAVPIRYDRHKALAIIGFQLDSDTRTHVPDSHSPRRRGNPKSDSTVRFYPLDELAELRWDMAESSAWMLPRVLMDERG